jgi:hypothetical protein
MKRHNKEKPLYDQVARFTEDSFNCNAVKQQVGTRHGRIDVVGLREVHTDYLSSPEVIGIEVKEEASTFLSSLGQAFAYSVFAHQCYLAVRKRHSNAFTPDEMRIAAKLGVGLIKIKARSCVLVQSSRLFEPEPRYVAHLLKKMGYFQCALCGGTYKQENMTYASSRAIDLTDNPRNLGNFRKAIIKRRNFQFYLFQLYQERRTEDRYYVWDRRFMCKDCISLFASLMPRKQ